MLSAVAVAVAAAVLAAPPVPPDHAAKMAKGTEVFKTHIRPVLVKECLRCHGGEATEAEFDLTDRDRLLKGGTGGAAVVPGDAKKSRLYRLVTHAKKPAMPEDAPKLPDAVLAKFAEWIDLGAPYDKPLIDRAEERTAWTRRVVAPEARRHWAFQPLTRPAPPAVRDAAWCRTTADRFVKAKLEAAGLTPSPEADRRTLIRRVTFDLLGLPPTPQEIDAFLADTRPNAYERVVDRLLESPHYGERWGRHWLDLARFAESHGFEHDYDRPTAYVYRDFVIKALNADLPYDRFVKWQLAGDEYAPDDPLALAATGFLAAGVHSTQITANEVEKHRYDEMDDMLATTGTSMLGLTLGCARCHDHKYDPVPQADYYRLLATFTSTVRAEVELSDDRPALERAKAAWEKAHAPLAAAVAAREKELAAKAADWEAAAAKNDKLDAKVKAALGKPAAKRSKSDAALLVKTQHEQDAEWVKRNKAAADHEKVKPAGPMGLVCTEGVKAVRLHTQGGDLLPTTHFLRRGDTSQKEGEAAPSFLQVLMPGPDAAARWQAEPPAGARTSFRRRAFAEWLCDTEQGAGRLLARVIVNRLWQHHLGRGIVATPSDFGVRGEPPSHPELLDWLAGQLIDGGWRLKAVHKLIVTGSAYRQESASRMTPAEATAALKADPENRLFGRRPLRRLEAEAVRDAVLAASGVLDPKMFGPGTLDANSRRRSVYFTVKRSQLIPVLQVFDAPDASGSVGERPTTTIAPQALWLLNSPQVRVAAKALAATLPTANEEAVAVVYRRCLGREPTAEERTRAVEFLAAQAAAHAANGRADGAATARADLAQTVFCLNEFVYAE
jgi:hypothetical protein